MSSVSSTSSSSSTGNLTFSGIASGMDTEEIIKKLMTGKQTKIDKAKQKKQLLEWKQAAYRNTTKLINEFKNKYFDSLSNTYIGSSSFFSAKSVTSSSSALTATASSSAQNGTITINSATMATSAELTSGAPVSPELTGSAAASDLFSAGTAIVNFTLDGVTKAIKFTSTDDLKNQLNSAFGSGKINVTVTDGKYTFETGDSTSRLVLTASGETAHANDITKLGFTSGQSNHISNSTKISSLIDFGGSSTYTLKINDTEITLNNTDTLSNVISKINSSNAGVTMSYSSFTDKLSLASKLTGQSAKVDISDAGGKFLSGLFGITGTTAQKSGTDATISVTADGTTQTLTRSSNTFDVSGISVTLNNNITSAATIGVATSTDTALTNMKNFVADYNALIDSLFATTEESYDSDYPPLTDAQKEDMSEKEIESWEKKAKTGLLRDDSELNDFMSDLRYVLYDSVKSSGLSAYAIGIDTTKVHNDGGKLVFDEAKFKKALEENTEGVLELFGNSDTGLAEGYEKVINKYASIERFNTGRKDAKGSTIFTRGSLVELAGYTTNATDKDNDIYDDIKDLNSKISELKNDYDAEYRRQVSRFASLEKSISSLNSQSSYLSSMFK